MLTPTLKQEQGIKLLKQRILNKEKVSVLQGVAGAGKSTSLKFLLQSLPYKKEEIVFLSFTGAAVQVLKRQRLSAQTLHSFLFTPMRAGRRRINRLKPARIYSHIKLIVVDEFSMLTQPFLENLLTYNIPILLVGDSFQIPAIGTPNAYLNKADVFLDEPMRQALDNPVLWAANKIRRQEEVADGFYDNILFVGKQDHMHENWFSKDFQFICKQNPTRHWLNQIINQSQEPKVEDRIIFQQNDWSKNITNGTLATITKISRFRDKYFVDFTTEFGLEKRRYETFFQKESAWSQSFDWAYAITAHKAQGITFDCPGVVYDETKTNSIYSQKFTYTALTRFTGKYLVGWLRN